MLAALLRQTFNNTFKINNTVCKNAKVSFYLIVSTQISKINVK